MMWSDVMWWGRVRGEECGQVEWDRVGWNGIWRAM